jgi:hypothetical protein
LAEGEQCFVLCHLDADRAWSHRPRRSDIEVVREFSKYLIGLAALPTRKVTALNTPEALQRAAKERLLYIIPYYSIESWLYHNVDLALRLCQEKYQGRSVEDFLHWREHPGELDDKLKPKDSTCLCSKHNRELAEQDYPTKRVYDIGKSFQATVHLLRDNIALRRALAEGASP